MNLCYDPILFFIHQVLLSTHQGFVQRVTQYQISGAISNSIPDELWKALFSYFSELITAFEKKEDNEIRKVLEKFSNLWYATTGNGFYLYLQKRLII